MDPENVAVVRKTEMDRWNINNTVRFYRVWEKETDHERKL